MELYNQQCSVLMGLLNDLSTEIKADTWNAIMDQPEKIRCNYQSLNNPSVMEKII